MTLLKCLIRHHGKTAPIATNVAEACLIAANIEQTDDRVQAEAAQELLRVVGRGLPMNQHPVIATLILHRLTLKHATPERHQAIRHRVHSFWRAAQHQKGAGSFSRTLINVLQAIQTALAQNQISFLKTEREVLQCETHPFAPAAAPLETFLTSELAQLRGQTLLDDLLSQQRAGNLFAGTAPTSKTEPLPNAHLTLPEIAKTVEQQIVHAPPNQNGGTSKTCEYTLVANRTEVTGQSAKTGEQEPQFASYFNRDYRLQSAPDKKMIAEIEAHLQNRAPWLKPAIQALMLDLKRSSNSKYNTLSLSPLLLIGPPGNGKTALLREFAKQTKAPFAFLDVAGMDDCRTLKGTAAGWTNATPCWPAMMAHQFKCLNPVLFLDEIDKCGRTRSNGNVHDALVTHLEKETAATYFDEALQATIDLSHCNWVFAANDLSQVPPVLRSRLRIVQCAAPDAEHFDIALTNCGADILKDFPDTAYGIDEALSPNEKAALKRIFVASNGDLRKLKQALHGLLQLPPAKKVH
ncbi:MAG: AAA family ATPase [Alphaproteobacteria bacterium]